jgi:hypothetical protein
MSGRTSESVIDRVEVRKTRGGAKPATPVRLAWLTSRDVEAAALARLARKGYDWSCPQAQGRRSA